MRSSWPLRTRELLWPWLFMVLLGLTLSGCAKRSVPAASVPMAPGMMRDATKMAAESATPGGPALAGGMGGGEQSVVASPSAILPAVRNRKLIRSAQISLHVTKAEEALTKAQNIALKLGGLVGESSLQRQPDGSASGSVELRIPGDRFEEAITKLRELGRLVHLSSNVEDVTGAYTDLEARIRNAKRQEEEILKLYNRGGKLADIITVGDKLAQVRGEIEQMESQMRVMKDQVELSSITVVLSEKGEAPVAEDEYSVLYHVRGAWRIMLRLVQGILTFLINFIIWGWVIWLPIAILWWVAARRARARRIAARPTPPPPPAA